MREDLIVPNEKEESLSVMPEEIRSKVITEPFSPLEGRITIENPEMLPSLLKLKELIGVEAFDKHINTLQNIRRNATTVMLITDKELHRTNIEANYLLQIEQAFDVQFVRVVAIG